MSVVLPIEDDSRYRIYTATAGQTTFPVQFPFQDNGDIAAYVLNTTTSEYVEISSTLYTLTGAGNAAGGSLAFITGRELGDKILILGKTILERLSSIVRDGRFSSSLIDDELDRNRLIQQELFRDLGRAVKMEFGTGTGPIIVANLNDGDTLVFSGGRIISGPNLSDYQDVADAAAASAAAASSSATSAAASDADATYQAQLAQAAAAVMNAYLFSHSPPIIKYVRPHLYDYCVNALGQSVPPETQTDWRWSMIAALANRRVQLPPGNLPFTGTVAQPTPARGAGFIASLDTILVPNGGAENCIDIGDGINEYPNILFEGFRMWGSGVRTAGHAIHFRKCTDGSGIRNVRIGGALDYYQNGGAHKFLDGVYFDLFGECVVHNSSSIAAAASAIKCRGAADGSYGAELSIDGNTNVFAALRGAHVGGASNVYFQDVNFSLCAINIEINKTLQNVPNAQVFIQQGCTSDICSQAGIVLRSSACTDLEITSAWLASCLNIDGANLVIEPDTDITPRLKITGNRITNALGDAVQMNGGKSIMEANQIDLNGGFGVWLLGGHHRISGGAINDNAKSNPTISRVYNLRVESGVSGEALNVDMSGGVESGASNSSSAFSIKRSKGYPSEASGSVSIPSGVSEFVVTHGLDKPPPIQNIQLTPASNLGAAGVAYYWVSATSSPTFTIAFNATATGAMQINWSAWLD